MKSLGLLAVMLYCMLYAALACTAQEGSLPQISAADSIRMPGDLNQLDYYLITVDVGDHVWDNFGHTALRVVDRESNSDLVFNWGLFDISVGNVTFASNFLRGILNYQLGVSPPAWELGRYEREQRTVWQEKINLTNEQKAVLYRRLAWNLREENIVYSYQYFFDNCTTRVRDYLNEALGGRLQNQNQVEVQRSFRDEVLAHYATVPYVAVSLDVLMNARIDRNMTQWEQMFLPAQLRQELLGFQSDVYANGQRLPMLGESIVLMEFDAPEPRTNAYYFLAPGLLIPLALLFLKLKKIPLSSFTAQAGYSLRNPAFSYRFLGLIGLLVALTSGIYGLIMSISWAGSAHLDLHSNLNLFVFWPTDLFGVFFALRWLLSGSACAVSRTMYGLIQFYFFAHLLAAVVYLFMVVTGIAEQRVTSVLIFVAPALSALAVLIWNAGFVTVRTMRFG